MSKYRVDYVKMYKHHPLWPNQSFYMVYDVHRKRYLLGLYVTEGAANSAIARRCQRETV